MRGDVPVRAQDGGRVAFLSVQLAGRVACWGHAVLALLVGIVFVWEGDESFDSPVWAVLRWDRGVWVIRVLGVVFLVGCLLLSVASVTRRRQRSALAFLAALWLVVEISLLWTGIGKEASLFGSVAVLGVIMSLVNTTIALDDAEPLAVYPESAP